MLEKWRKRLHATSDNELESYSKQVKRCIEIALSCLEADRSNRPSIGDIIRKLNETEAMHQIDSGFTYDRGLSFSSINQVCLVMEQYLLLFRSSHFLI